MHVKTSKSSDSMAVDKPGALVTSKLANKATSFADVNAFSFKKQKLERTNDTENEPGDGRQPMDQLLAKLSQQQDLIEQQRQALTSGDDQESSSDGSMHFTPATDSVRSTPPDHGNEPKSEVNELARLKQELYAAQYKIAKMDQELSQTRITKHTIDQALGSPSEIDLPFRSKCPEQPVKNLQANANAPTRPFGGRRDSWMAMDDARSEKSDPVSVGPFNQSSAIWGVSGDPKYRDAAKNWGEESAGPWSGRGLSLGLQTQPPLSRGFPSAPPQGSTTDAQYVNNVNQIQASQPVVRSNLQAGRGSAPPFNQRTGWPTYPAGASASEGMGTAPNTSHSAGMIPGPVAYQPRPIGTPLSPTAAEFTASQATANPWNAPPSTSPGPTYVSPIEPLNYRRLLDRTVNCNWKYIVDKIVCNNDQQASIFLQQKLKIGTGEQKFDIVEAIVSQAYPLMINRFGNFLIQRCFEHGNPEQIVAIANAIRGNTLTLSMDAFGCHVVQKAFDCVPENFKAIMVHELLRRIPETVIHRYACHVWQKLFELRWNDSPPQIMKYVNDALCGMWHEVALGETGSLVVQNIFENCLEEDKRPCINEVLNGIDLIARGQFGNWCIQHVCEHGLPADRSRAIDHVVRHAVDYSMDQFASKVVEKCLKIGGSDFLERYLDRICEGRLDRPRIPLIDIASDQFGNYLIQYILTHSNPQHRETVATHVR
ncbi:MAG: hypothetical protein M1837_001567 [Sclerophora amabilis]|nr:MAG: hypothetical protein M1837_001567 [Sclerophora amabilis]